MRKILAVLALLLLPLGASAFDKGEVVQVGGACDSPSSVLKMLNALESNDGATQTALLSEKKCFHLPGAVAMITEPVSNTFEVGGKVWQVWKGKNPLLGDVYFLENLPAVKL